MNDTIKILVNNFNTYSCTLATFIGNINNKNINFKFYKNEIEKLTRKESVVMIDTFVLNGLKYEEYIMAGDEEFFLGEKYDNVTGNDDNLMMKVFEFKSIWKKLNQENKTQIINYMQILCQIAKVYLKYVAETRVNVR
jgi:hypothetical protein